MAKWLNETGVFKCSFFLLALVLASPVFAAEDSEQRQKIDQSASAALEELISKSGLAKALSDDAAGILIFPRITEIGYGVGIDAGVGVLRSGGKSTGYFQSTSFSIGVQAGLETHSVVVMFLTNEALGKFDNFIKEGGFDLDKDADITLVGDDDSVQTLVADSTSDIVGFIFDKSGSMADASFEATVITPLKMQ